MYEQMNLFDLMNHKEETQPLYKKGDVVYKVTKDVIVESIVERSFRVENGYGYHAIGSTFWDTSIGQDIFNTYDAAKRKTDENLKSLVVIRGKDLMPIKQRSFIHYRPDYTMNNGKPYLINATVALMENMTYVQDWGCYHFLYIFNSNKKAEKKYEEALKKIMQYTDEWYLETVIQKELEDVYKVNDSTYAHYLYNEH